MMLMRLPSRKVGAIERAPFSMTESHKKGIMWALFAVGTVLMIMVMHPGVLQWD